MCMWGAIKGAYVVATCGVGGLQMEYVCHLCGGNRKIAASLRPSPLLELP